jgi:hypothetical protein
MRETGALVDFMVKRGDRVFSMGLQGPFDLIIIKRKMNLLEILH